MAYDKVKYSNTKTRRQNINDARTYFNYDLVKAHEIFNDESFQIGVRWFNKGRSLDIAPKSLRDNVKFRCGYDYAKKEMYKQTFQLGYRHFMNGGTLESIPTEYQNNNVFKAGFKKAMEDSLKDDKGRNSSKR